MARSGVDVNLRDFQRFIGVCDDALREGAKKGVTDALELWQIEATNIAPIGRYDGRRGGNLRANIDRTRPVVSGLNVDGTLVANAFNDGFNYGYYVHEVAPGKGQSANTPGTTLEFLDKSLDDNKARLQRLIEDAIEAEIRRRGLA
jgi:hypothetical protein